MKTSLWDQCRRFLSAMASELPDYRDIRDLSGRLERIRAEIEHTGTYTHTYRELEFGARLAWRNSNRCIGRHMFRSLEVVDCRQAANAEQVTACLEDHVRRATNGGRIQSIISVFGARSPGVPRRPDPVRLGNHQLIRYAGFPDSGDGVLGDPHSADFTRHCLQQGWHPSEAGAFTPLPWSIWIDGEEQPPYDVFAETPELLLEVELRHPDNSSFERLGLRWYAAPILSDMALVVGGIVYPCAPFNGWYMGTEIGSRNLADSNRYDMLERVAAVLGLDTSTERTLWRDRAMIELNRAVLYSFDACGVTIEDHHELSRRFDRFRGALERKGSAMTGDWAWLTPPITAPQTPQYHRNFDNTVCLHTNFFYQDPIWSDRREVDLPSASDACPFTLQTDLPKSP